MVTPHEPKPLFSLGQIVATQGAAALLEGSDVTAESLIDRHVHGDWGSAGLYHVTELTADELARGPLATSDDAKLNRQAIDSGDKCRILSVYRVGGEKIRCITDGGWETTTLLLPSEY